MRARPASGMTETLYACPPSRMLQSRSLWPHLVHRARCRSRSLDVSAPHPIISGTRAIGAWCSISRSRPRSNSGCAEAPQASDVAPAAAAWRENGRD